MTDCKHGTDIDEFDCINCENEIIDFDKWWENYSVKDKERIANYRLAGISEWHLAREAWLAAIQYMVDEFHIGQ